MGDRTGYGQGPRVLACEGCGTVHAMRDLPTGAVAECQTCGIELARGRHGSREVVLALSLAALLLFAVAHLWPFMTMTLEGQSQTVTILTGVAMLARAGMWPLSLLVLGVASLVPLIRLVGTVLVLWPGLGQRQPRLAAAVFRWLEGLNRWAMMEVYLLGVIVAYVKLSDLARIELDVALFAFVSVILLMITADAALERERVWDGFGRQAGRGLLRPGARPPLACQTCRQLVPDGRHEGPPHCPRCGAALHRRKPAALARTTALVAAAAFLYIPANLLPVMSVAYFGAGVPDTILSGVEQLWAAGMYPVALLVFFASITVPCLKLAGLSWLLLSVRFSRLGSPRLRTVAYRIIEGIGRWSMVDIFMISILVGLVDLGAVATVEPGPGALCFAAVVILTMLASASFDPRLIWDAWQEDSEQAGFIRV